jgi:DNA repair exonuclease SbcCD ATPase subunit
MTLRPEPDEGTAMSQEIQRLTELVQSTQSIASGTEKAVREILTSHVEAVHDLRVQITALRSMLQDEDGALLRLWKMEEAVRKLEREVSELRRLLDTMRDMRAQQGRVQWSGVALLVTTVVAIAAILLSIISYVSR